MITFRFRAQAGKFFNVRSKTAIGRDMGDNGQFFLPRQLQIVLPERRSDMHYPCPIRRADKIRLLNFPRILYLRQSRRMGNNRTRAYTLNPTAFSRKIPASKVPRPPAIQDSMLPKKNFSPTKDDRFFIT